MRWVVGYCLPQFLLEKISRKQLQFLFPSEKKKSGTEQHFPELSMKER